MSCERNHGTSQADAVCTAIREAWQSLDLLRPGLGLALGWNFFALNRHNGEVQIQFVNCIGGVVLVQLQEKLAQGNYTA